VDGRKSLPQNGIAAKLPMVLKALRCFFEGADPESQQIHHSAQMQKCALLTSYSYQSRKSGMAVHQETEKALALMLVDWLEDAKGTWMEYQLISLQEEQLRVALLWMIDRLGLLLPLLQLSIENINIAA